MVIDVTTGILLSFCNPSKVETALLEMNDAVVAVTADKVVLFTNVKMIRTSTRLRIAMNVMRRKNNYDDVMFSAVKLEWMACAAALRSEVVHRSFKYCSVGFILFIAGGFIGLPITPLLLPSVVGQTANCKLQLSTFSFAC